MRQLKLPLGWDKVPEGIGEIAPRVPGWLITIAALSLGAPFWFDLLSRLVRVRGSGGAQRPQAPSDATGAQGTGPTPRE